MSIDWLVPPDPTWKDVLVLVNLVGIVALALAWLVELALRLYRLDPLSRKLLDALGKPEFVTANPTAPFVEAKLTPDGGVKGVVTLCPPAVMVCGYLVHDLLGKRGFDKIVRKAREISRAARLKHMKVHMEIKLDE